MLNGREASSWRVLLVDDEPDNIEVVAESLEFYGMMVQTADNGELGLEALKSFTPDLILLDLSMPVMDGWQMLRNLKANPETTVQVGTEKRAVRARVATAAECDRLWKLMVGVCSGYDQYQQRTDFHKRVPPGFG